MIRLRPWASSIHASGRLSLDLFCFERRGRARNRAPSPSEAVCCASPSVSWPSVTALRALLALLGLGAGEDAVAEAPTADAFDTSDGRRFFLMVRTGCGTSSSCEALRFRSERVPSGGSSGRMSSLKIECPPGSTPRCDGSKSLASLGTDDSLRRVSDSMGSFSSWLSSCKSFCMQALHRQCFASIKISGHCIEQGLEGPLYRHPGLAC
jgi:hypothetical protein